MTKLEEKPIINKEIFNVDVNIFELVQKVYDKNFNREKNKIGCSELPHCARKTIISRLFNIPSKTNMKMLHGKIHHSIIQEPKILSNLISSIYQQLAIKKKEINVITEKHLIYEILPGKFLEGHVDIFTDDFLFEIKTTSVPLEYSKEIVLFYYVQTNTYLKLVNLTLGFILCINLRAFQSDMTNLSNIWKKYGYIIPIHFNQELYNKTIEKAILMFKFIDQNEFHITGPEFKWECKNCSKEIKEICLKEQKKEFS